LAAEAGWTFVLRGDKYLTHGEMRALDCPARTLVAVPSEISELPYDPLTPTIIT